MTGVRRLSDTEVQVNAQFGATLNTTALDQTHPSGIVFGTGQGAVIYQDPFDPNPTDIDIQANILSASTGRPVGVQIAAPGLGFSATVDLHPQAAVLANVNDPSVPQNRALVVWDSLTATHDIFGQLITANGDKLTAAPFALAATANNEEFPDVAALPNGRSVVVWQNTNLGSVSAEVLNVDGHTTFLAPFRVDTLGASTAPVVAALGNNFVVAWRGADIDQGGIHAALFDGQTGARIGNELGLATNPLNTVTAGNQSEPAITRLSNGGFVVVWTDSSTRPDINGKVDTSGTAIMFRVFDQNGTATSGEILANTITAGNQNHPSVASGPNGSFVIAWTDESGTADSLGNLDASATAIKAQAFSAAGEKLGGDLLVNHITAGNQDFVSLFTAPDGTILATFQDSSGQVDGTQTPDTSGFGIQAMGLTIDLDTIVTGLGPLPVFRFFDTHDGGHFFTTSTAERDQVQATRPDMNFEGVGYKAVNPANNDPSATPVYRFFDTHDGGHFFTISAAERDQVLATRHDLSFEGIGYSEHATQQAGDSAVYRFFETTSGGHFFTASTTERDTVMATRSDMRFEGTAFFAPTT